MIHPPLSRHESLQPLSRDHYAGLVQSRHLLKAAEGGEQGRRAALREFVAAWQRELHPHLLDEERLLLPLVTEPRMISRLVREHSALRTYAARATQAIEGDAPLDPELLRAIGHLLRAHIRWEERELFPAIQQSASPDAMRLLSERTAKIESVRPRWIDRKRPEHVHATD